jgi:hypothetical protein
MAVSIVGSSEGREGKSGCRANGKTIENYHTFHYLINAGSKTETRENILYSGVLPFAGITTRADGSYCSSVDITRDQANAQYWHGVVEYSTRANDQELGDGSVANDPTTWNPIWKIDNSLHDFVTPMDFNGTPVLNSAKQPFDQGIVRTRTITTFRFAQYESNTLTEKQIAKRNNSTNDREYKGFDKNTLKLTIEGSERGFFANVAARKIFYRIDYYQGDPKKTFKVWNKGSSTWVDSNNDDSGWMEVRVDIGPTYVEAGERKRAMTDQGHLDQFNLDGAGGWVGEDASGFQKQPAFLAFQNLMSLDFKSFLRG